MSVPRATALALEPPVVKDPVAVAGPLALEPSALEPPVTEDPTPSMPLRRTVIIKGRGAERHLPWESGIAPRRPSSLPHHRSGFRPDRLAMWAMVLGMLLVMVAALSGH